MTALADPTRRRLFDRLRRRPHAVGELARHLGVSQPAVSQHLAVLRRARLERIRGGRECVWGTVTAWEPSRRVAFTWHPGEEPETAQDVEVRFTAVGARTRVDLEHKGFERMGRMARKARRGYPIGWAYVLGLYAGRRGPFMMLISGLTAVGMMVMRRRAAAAASRV